MEQIQQLRRITIWGVGLIGGSLGLALKKNGFQGQRVGLGRNIGRLQNALEHDAVDVITTALADGLTETDLVVLCTPVALIPRLVQQIIESVDTRQHRIVLTDVGQHKVNTRRDNRGAATRTESRCPLFYWWPSNGGFS